MYELNFVGRALDDNIRYFRRVLRKFVLDKKSLPYKDFRNSLSAYLKWFVVAATGWIAPRM